VTPYARQARWVAVVACALYAAASAAVGVWVAARAEYATRAAEAAVLARRLRGANRVTGTSLSDSARAALAARDVPTTAGAGRVIVTGDTGLVHGRVPWLTPRDLRMLAREDRPLVLGRGLIRLVTVPVKDADEWDIVGVVGVEARPAPRAEPLAALALAAALAALGLSTGACGRLARGDLAVGRLLAAGATTVLIAAAAALVWWERSLLASAVHATTAASSRGPVGQGLPIPSLGVIALLHACSALGGVAGVLAAVWLTGPRRRAEVRETVAAWSFLAPSLAHLLVFSVGPLLFALYISFFQWDLLRAEKPFVALANYRELARDPLFWNALRNTAVYSLYVPLTMALALGAAMVVNQNLRGMRFVRAVAFLPYIASYVAIAIAWQWILDYDYGLLNWLLRQGGLAGVDWLGSPRTALPAVMLVSAWMQLGYQMVVYLAGLQGVPETLHDAARLDGAGAWQRFRHVTLPLLRPVHVYVFVTGVIWSFHAFTLVYVMTEGGPVHSTDVLVYQIYQNAWEFRRMGYASAMSWVLFVLLLALTLAQWRLIERQVDHA
jgi:multiple sugar transport system permease protein